MTMLQNWACSLRVLDRRASYRVSPLGSEQQDQISQLAVDIAKDLARDVYLQGETGTSSTVAVYTDLPDMLLVHKDQNFPRRESSSSSRVSM